MCSCEEVKLVLPFISNIHSVAYLEKNVADLNKKYVPCQVSTFISLLIFKERKIAIGLSCS